MKRLNHVNAVLAGSIVTIALAIGFVISNFAVAGTKSAQPRFKAASELTWADTGIGPVVAATVQGDFTNGSHMTFLRFPGGTKTSLHTHTTGFTGIVVSGTMRSPVPGRSETEKALPSGSYWVMPGGGEARDRVPSRW